jgi:tetratricopeptide (TPR) repeat protein
MVKCWIAVHKVPRAVRELQELSQLADLSDTQQGLILLWQADIALSRSIRHEENSLKQFKQALEKGLPEAEEAYARGFLAESTCEAVKCFQKAVEKDRFNPRAIGMLAMTLILFGELEEGRKHVLFGERVFPEDPNFMILHAMLFALEDKMPAAEKQLKKAEPQLTKRQTNTARDQVELLNLFCHGEEILFGDSIDFRTYLRVGKLVATLVATLLPDLAQVPASTNDPLLLPLPPVALKAFGCLRPAAEAMLWRRDKLDEAIKEVSHGVRLHPEGLLYVIDGLLFGMNNQWREAGAAFLKAADTPSIFPIRRRARYFAVMCDVNEAGDINKLAQNPEIMARALKHTRELVDLGGVRPDQAGILVQIALKNGELDLARSILAQWERQVPKENIPALLNRAEVELAGGSCRRAAELANRVLKVRPKDTDAQRISSDAINKIHEQALLFPLPDKDRPK